MLPKHENELVTRVGPGTPMGELMRQYWLPVLLSSELPDRDGRPLRVRLLGEDLIAFRDTEGRVGLLADHCSHRGASLFFGRNEDSGLRCVYHGWKYDVAGRCLDMPNEPPESNFKDKILQRAYPCRDVNGIVWTYLGPRPEPPSLPALEWAMVPASQRTPMRLHVRDCNWLQALEGDIDASHTSFLHRVLGAEKATEDAQRYKALDRHPRFETVDTDYGVMIAARRTPDLDRYYWRMTQFLMPCFTIIPPNGAKTETLPGRAWVPMDDHNSLIWYFDWHPSKALDQVDQSARSSGPTRPLRSSFDAQEEYQEPTTEPGGAWHFKGNRQNDYLQDYEAQRTQRFSGIPTIPLQDHAMTESMGPVMDRTSEHLGASDAGIIAVRRCLINAAERLRDDGATPPGVDDPAVYRVRSASGLLPKDAAWIEATKDWIAARPGTPIVSV